MKNEQRIWNKSELKQMPEWKLSSYGAWLRINGKHTLSEAMIGKPVQWCKDQGYTVTDEMIAKTETEQTKELVVEILNEASERKFNIKPLNDSLDWVKWLEESKYHGLNEASQCNAIRDIYTKINEIIKYLNAKEAAEAGLFDNETKN